jgi:hypothetical protein
MPGFSTSSHLTKITNNRVSPILFGFFAIAETGFFFRSQNKILKFNVPLLTLVVMILRTAAIELNRGFR